MNRISGNTVALLAGLLLLLGAVLGVTRLLDERVFALLANSFLLASGTCACAVPLGVAVSLLGYRSASWWAPLLVVVLLVMLFQPVYLQAAGWDAGFGRQGWFSFSNAVSRSPWLESWQAAIWIHTLVALPWVVLIVTLGMRLNNPAFEETAMLEASYSRVFWRVTLPQLTPAILTAVLWVFVSTCGEMTIADLFQIRTFAEEVYTTLPWQRQADSDLPFWAGTLLITLLAALAVLTFSRLSMQLSSVIYRNPARLRLVFPWSWAARGLLGFVAFAIAVPTANLFVNAGIEVLADADGLKRVWSFQKLVSQLASTPGRFGQEFGWSLLIGGSAATAATLLAVGEAWLARSSAAIRWSGAMLAAVCFAVPGPIFGVLLIRVLSQDEGSVLLWLYDRTIFAPWLAMTIRAFPIALLICRFAIHSLPTELLETAATEGASSWQQLVRIALPARWSAFAGAWLAGLAVAMGDLSATILVTPPGVSTLATRVFGLLHAGVDDQVAALCLMIELMFLVLGIAIWRSTRADQKTAE